MNDGKQGNQLQDYGNEAARTEKKNEYKAEEYPGQQAGMGQLIGQLMVY